MNAHDEKSVLSDEAFARQLQAEEEANMADEQLARKLANADLNGNSNSYSDHNSNNSNYNSNNSNYNSHNYNSNGASGPHMVPASSRLRPGDSNGDNVQLYAPPPGLPPTISGAGNASGFGNGSDLPPPPGNSLASYETRQSTRQVAHSHHTNQVIEAGKIRSRDEQQMQNLLQTLQYKYRIYNSELEPEHESDYPCGCPIHQYQRAKWARSAVQDMWSEAVIYPGEKSYNANQPYNSTFFSGNPYQYRVVSPYFATFSGSWGPKQASPRSHAQWTTQTIALNNQLNQQALTNIDAKEPRINIWYEGGGDDKKAPVIPVADAKQGQEKNGFVQERQGFRPEKNGYGQEKAVKGYPNDKKTGEKGDSKLENEKQGLASQSSSSADHNMPGPSKEKGWKQHEPGSQARPDLARAVSANKSASKFSSFRKSIGIKSKDERLDAKVEKDMNKGATLRNSILAEEQGRWPDDEWREIVRVYLEKTGMSKKVGDVRNRQPIQYLHLLRAGYFEPIPVSWANQASNPLKFSIEPAAGWRGITPAWRGYEDTAEERLYWVLNHREGSTGTRLKPDFVSALDLARERMSRAVEPPPEYFDTNDTCHVQHTTDGYSKQVMPPPFRAFDRPESPNDDTMILLDVSGSMDFVPQRPIYDRYLVTGYQNTSQPKNKDLAKAIIRRFVDAMSNHDHQFGGYDFTTFSSSAKYIGTVHHRNLDQLWRTVNIGGGTRVMTGWQKVKELHFRKHSESAIHHPVYGWQAGPQTPILRLLLLLDGEATDMDEFELDLLGLSWAHVTIFLIGVDGCPHHHRHANELQRISDVNHHVSFVNAQGNTPERYVTHELLKRHLGYELSMSEFQEIETPPTYDEAIQ